MVQNLRQLAYSVLGAVLCGCAGSQAGAAAHPEAMATSDSASGTAALEDAPPAPANAGPQTKIAFDPNQGELPESLLLDDEGNFYFSMGGRVTRWNEAQGLQEYAQLPIPDGALALGLEFGSDGCVYTATGAFAAEPPAAFVFKICAQGQPQKVASLDPRGFPNDLAFDAEGRLYVTDPFLGRVYRIAADGSAEIWLEHPLLAGRKDAPILPAHHFGVDGIVADTAANAFYVGNLDQGKILRLSFDATGAATAPTVVADDPELRGVDGLLLTSDGSLLAAINGQDQLAVVGPGGAVQVWAEGAPLDAPSALVFGTAPEERDAVYVSSFAINRVVRGGAEPPQPALVRIALPTAP